jgi:hypothetical protein
MIAGRCPPYSRRSTLVDETDESLTTLGGDVEAEIKEMMGLFDAPAFARRGQELEDTLRRLDNRCRLARIERLDMVHLRLRQWARAVTGPEAWTAVFSASIELLWTLSEAEPPEWAREAAPLRRQLESARDLIAAVLRFNHRWLQFLGSLRLEAANSVIDDYNRYYLLEKECVMGSARLAARFFTPVPRLGREPLLHDHPLLPVPRLLDRVKKDAHFLASETDS